MEKYNTFKQEKNTLVHTRILDAPRALVWEVWTKPEHIQEWFGPDGFTLTNKSMQVKPGGQWNSIMHGWGQNFDSKVEYIEVIQPSKLSYKHFGYKEDYDYFVTLTFEEIKDKTLLTMTSVFKSEEIIKELNEKVNAIESGKQTLNKLEQYINLQVKKNQ